MKQENNEIIILTPEDYTKQCISAGITCTGDGLLRDFITRGNYHGALLIMDEAITKRQHEINFLKDLQANLKHEITKTIKEK